jgi:hypothetical protein
LKRLRVIVSVPLLLNVGFAALLLGGCSHGAAPKATPAAAPGSIDATVRDTAECSAPRLGDKSRENIFVTEQRYGHDGFFLGPRGKIYWDCLLHPKPYQYANLYPDQMASYWFGTFKIPAGAVLTMRVQYPRARYFEVALYKKQGINITATGEVLVDTQFRPDQGSTNPYLVGANRLSDHRSFTIKIAAQNATTPIANRANNTLYAGAGGGVIQYVLRIYLPDVGYDGGGWLPIDLNSTTRGLPTYEATLADGRRLSSEQIVKQWVQPQGATPAGMTAKQWHALILLSRVNGSGLKIETSPARNPARWEKYFNTKYSLVGLFDSPAKRAKLPQSAETGFGGDPVTQFFMVVLSRRFGPVYVFRGKMPTFPNTYSGGNGKGLAVMPDAQLRYWSVIMSEAPPSGKGDDAVSDMQVPLDAKHSYTIVVSRPEDRPSNATLQNGIAWIEWDRAGEGLSGPFNRSDFGLLLMRYMLVNPSWKQSPSNVTVPGTEAQVMGPYFPRGVYTDKATFEKSGPGIIKSLEPR